MPIWARDTGERQFHPPRISRGILLILLNHLARTTSSNLLFIILIRIITMATPAMSITWRDSANDTLYEKERVDRVFNAIKPNRYPRAIVKVTHPLHVQEAVKLANKLQCRVSVRSGGHSWAAWGVRDDAILIDLERLNEIELDESKKIVKASPSTTGIMLNESIGKKGFMFGGGHCPDVGIGGFLLQGGMGWNCKV